MTREELINAINDSDKKWSCPERPCNKPEEEGNTGECCMECAEKQLAEYDKQIYNKALEDFGKKMKEANSIALYYRDIVDLEEFMQAASDEIKEELMK